MSALAIFLVTKETAEDMVPDLAACGITVYADQAYQTLLNHSARRMTIAEASLIVLPPFAAWETNWPIYKGGSRNFVRQGEFCGAKVYELARILYRGAALWKCGGVRTRPIASACEPPPKALVMDSMPSYSHLPEDAHNDPGIIWAKLNMLEGYWRAQDISMPPPLHRADMINTATSPDLSTLLPSSRKYFLTFKGKFSSHPVRRRLSKLHNPVEGIVIVDSSSSDSESYNYTDLMVNTRFALVPRGDVEFSYRFTEAVCSGSIPVLVADGWVPPFSDGRNVVRAIPPFEEYGVRILEPVALKAVVPRLQSIAEDTCARMQRIAREVWDNHMRSVDVSIDTMVDLALGRV